MLDARAHLKDLMANVDHLTKTAETRASTRIKAAKTAEDVHAAMADAVDEVTSKAASVVAELRKAAALGLQKRAEKVAVARHIFRTAVRLAAC